MDSFLFVAFLKAYVYTVAIELVVCYAINRQIGFKKVLWTVILVNAFSLSIVWFLLPKYSVSYVEYLVAAEALAVVSEALLMKAILRFSIRRAFATSFAMNMASFFFGILFPWAIL
jgi:hypothetical protein